MIDLKVLGGIPVCLVKTDEKWEEFLNPVCKAMVMMVKSVDKRSCFAEAILSLVKYLDGDIPTISLNLR